MACHCSRPKLGRLAFLKRLAAAFWVLPLAGKINLANNIAEAVVVCGFPCRAALIEGAEEFVRRWYAGRSA